MKACPACQSAWKTVLEYPEGQIRICGHCGLQSGARRQEGYLGNAPGSTYYTMDNVEVDSYTPFLNFLNTIKNIMGEEPLSLLDVGCGGGQFIDFCLRHGIDACGIEPDLRAKDIMSKAVARRVAFDYIESVDMRGKRFDIITFWDSFEHIPTGFPLLDSLKNLLTPNGLVFMRVNNTHDIYNYISKFMLRVFPPVGRKVQKSCFNFPSHVWNFSQTAIRDLAKAHGWVIMSSTFTDTPAERLFTNPLLRTVAKTLYLVNAGMGGGKIGEYYMRPHTAG